jgi:hypothetical protein
LGKLREDPFGPGRVGDSAASRGIGDGAMDLDLALAGILIVGLAAVWLIPS